MAHNEFEVLWYLVSMRNVTGNDARELPYLLASLVVLAEALLICHFTPHYLAAPRFYLRRYPLRYISFGQL